MQNNKSRRGLPGTLAMCASLLGMVLVAPPSFAVPTASQQVLDRVFAFGPNDVIDLATGNASSVQPFTDLGITGDDFITCSLTAVNGLYCHTEFLGRKVRDVEDFDWSRLDIRDIVGEAKYPLPSE